MKASINDLNDMCRILNEAIKDDVFYIGCAYGGVSLQKRNSDGSVTDVLGGHMPKRRLYDMMVGWAKIRGFISC